MLTSTDQHNEHYGWRLYEQYGGYIADRLYDLLCWIAYKNSGDIPRGICLSTLERSYLEGWGQPSEEKINEWS
jgi:ribulose kinase